MTAQRGTDKPLPERCLRGLKDKDCIERTQNSSNVWISAKAFEPHWKTLQDRVSSRHKSNHYESSINWEDHPVEPFQILCRHPQNAKCGIVSIRLADLETAQQVNPRAAVFLEWERDPIKGNVFHGNLLFSGSLPKPMVRELAAVVATHVQDKIIFIEPENYDSELAARATRTTAFSESKPTNLWQRFLAFVYALFS